MRTYEEIEEAVEASQQCVDTDFGAGVRFHSKWVVGPNSSLAEDQSLACSINAELKELCRQNAIGMSQYDANVLRNVLNELKAESDAAERARW